MLSYLGSPIPLENLLYKPDSSLLKQAYQPQMLHMLNLAGFGMMAWDPGSRMPDIPYRYATTDLPTFDGNLRNLARKLRPSCTLAHVRGVPYQDRVHVSRQNLHPFYYDETSLASPTTAISLNSSTISSPSPSTSARRFGPGSAAARTANGYTRCC